MGPTYYNIAHHAIRCGLCSLFGLGQFTCDECKQGVTALGQYLQTPNEIAAVEQALSDLVCPTLPEDKIEACIDFVYTNWEAMATALFAYENTLTDICGALGYCTKFQRAFGVKITCGDCAAEMAKLAGVLADPTFAAGVKDNIAGPAYCESSYEVTGDVTKCKEWIELMGVQAISALGSLLAVSAERICGELGCTK